MSKEKEAIAAEILTYEKKEKENEKIKEREGRDR